jgi:hypothetical protein
MRSYVIRLVCVLSLAAAWGCKQEKVAPSATPAAPPQPSLHSSASATPGQVAQPAVTEVQSPADTSLLIELHGCADLLLSDERGYKTGYDTEAKKSYQDIPHSVYDEGDTISDDDSDASPAKTETAAAKQQECVTEKSLEVPQPAAGAYVLRVQNSTGNPFKLRITSYRDAKDNGQFTADKASARPQIYTYRFHLPPSTGTLEVTVAP